MSAREERWPMRWPLLAQLRDGDPLGRGTSVRSRRSAQLRARTVDADRVVKSVCPYCAVGCAQNVYVSDERVVQIEGDPDAPHSRGRLCPKGSASLQLTTGSARQRHVLCRAPHAADWQRLDLEAAMDMVAERMIATRREGWQWERDGRWTRRCMSIAGLGGATLDNEENYPTDSIQFGELEELRARAGARVEQLHAAGVVEARLYGHDADDGVGGDGAFFLLLDEPEVYGLPPDPVVTTRDLPGIWRSAGLAAAALLLGGAASFVGARR